jgi:methylmalonyl-CoA/ethylmalonyl-CoA epimerase
MVLSQDIKKITELDRVDQIGIVVKDIDKKSHDYARLFGISFPRVFVPEYHTKMYLGKPGDFLIRVALGNLGAVEIELIQHLEGEGLHKEFLNKKGEGLHHLGFLVTNLDEKIEALGTLGVKVLMSGERVGARFAYLDTEALLGTVFELIERE